MEGTTFLRTDDGGGDGAWYSQACRFLNVKYRNHSLIEKSFIARTIQYIIDRNECFDDYFHCRKENDCKLKHDMNWLSLFVDILS
jgi:hypothetical protein